MVLQHVIKVYHKKDKGEYDSVVSASKVTYYVCMHRVFEYTREAYIRYLPCEGHSFLFLCRLTQLRVLSRCTRCLRLRFTS